MIMVIDCDQQAVHVVDIWYVSQPIVEAVFSPDGSALATASVDGEVKFFQIDWNYTVEPPTYVQHFCI